MKNKVYALGTVKLSQNKSYFEDTRLWSIFSTIDNAEFAIINSADFYFEDCYTHAIIEEVSLSDAIDFRYVSESFWYKVHRKKDGLCGKVIKINKPKFLKQVVNFWVG